MEPKVVLITGGTSGYGKATAKKFCESGHHVIITGRKAETLKAAAAEIGAVPFQADVTNVSDWEALYHFIESKYGRLDLLINNAGGGVAIRNTWDQTIDTIDMALKLNLNSVIYGCQAFSKLFLQQKSGTIINISSVCAKHAWEGWSVYAAAKSGVLSYTKGLSTELGPHGIRVTCLIPGAGDTNFDANADFKDRGSTPMLKADDIAESIYGIFELPPHVWVEEMTVWGLDQIVVPL